MVGHNAVRVHRDMGLVSEAPERFQRSAAVANSAFTKRGDGPSRQRSLNRRWLSVPTIPQPVEFVFVSGDLGLIPCFVSLPVDEGVAQPGHRTRHDGPLCLRYCILTLFVVTVPLGGPWRPRRARAGTSRRPYEHSETSPRPHALPDGVLQRKLFLDDTLASACPARCTTLASGGAPGAAANVPSPKRPNNASAADDTPMRCRSASASARSDVQPVISPY